jgi:hypothetical protein
MFDNPPQDEAAIQAAWSEAQRRNNTSKKHPEWNGMPPNVGVLLGASGLLQLDADTPDEVAAWQAICAEYGFDPGPPTVRSPGSRGVDGEMKHRDGGHWLYQQGDVKFSSTVLALPVGSGPSGGSAVLYGGRRLTVIPPSVRDTGEYTDGGGLIGQPLPAFLAAMIAEADAKAPTPRGADSPFGVSGEYIATEQEWAWSEAVDWLDLLPDGWVLTHEERDGHQVYVHPSASSDRSAVAHVSGCSHFRNAKAPAPLTIHTTNPGDYLEVVVSIKCPASVSKLRMYALKHYQGDTRQARIALGFPSPSSTSMETAEAHPTAEALTTDNTPSVAENAETPAVETETAGDAETHASGEPVGLPPSWQPQDITGHIAWLLYGNAHPATPEVLRLIGSADAVDSSWQSRRTVLEARHIPTAWLAEQIGNVSVSRVHAVVRAMIPALQRDYGLIVRERLLDADPFKYGVRAQNADRTAWAVWLPAISDPSIPAERTA